MKYVMKNETHEQRSARWKEYYERTLKGKSGQWQREGYLKNPIAYEKRALHMYETKGKECRERFASKRTELHNLAAKNGCKTKTKLKADDLDKMLEYFHKLDAKRAKMKE